MIQNSLSAPVLILFFFNFFRACRRRRCSFRSFQFLLLAVGYLFQPFVCVELRSRARVRTMNKKNKNQNTCECSCLAENKRRSLRNRGRIARFTIWHGHGHTGSVYFIRSVPTDWTVLIRYWWIQTLSSRAVSFRCGFSGRFAFAAYEIVWPLRPGDIAIIPAEQQRSLNTHTHSSTTRISVCRPLNCICLSACGVCVSAVRLIYARFSEFIRRCCLCVCVFDVLYTLLGQPHAGWSLIYRIRFFFSVFLFLISFEFLLCVYWECRVAHFACDLDVLLRWTRVFLLLLVINIQYDTYLLCCDRRLEEYIRNRPAMKRPLLCLIFFFITLLLLIGSVRMYVLSAYCYAQELWSFCCCNL